MNEPDVRLRALAGLLAEHSVQTVVLTQGGASRELHARITDLPKELEVIAREGGKIEVPQLGAVIRFSGADVRCECADTATSIAILKTLAQS